MKTSEFVDLSYRLHEFSLEQLTNELTNLTKITSGLPYNHECVSDINEKLDQLYKITQSLNHVLDSSIELIDAELQVLASELIRVPYNRAPVEFERNERKTILSQDVENIISTRIAQYTSWQHAVLEIGPGDGKWTQHLVAGDPLYLLDIHREFLDSSIKQFREEYRKKIRLYQIGSDVFKTDVDMSALPKKQFGFIFAWNVFDYLPMGFIEAYLNQCFELLKPGGVMMFSYNDCEKKLCAELAETKFKSWVPKWKLNEILTKIGFEVITFESKEELVNWVEVKKPGELTSIRASQPLASIHVDPTRRPVDTAPERTYNKQQIDRLKQIAIQMNLGSAEDIMRDKHTPHQLHVMIENARTKK